MSKSIRENIGKTSCIIRNLECVALFAWTLQKMDIAEEGALRAARIFHIFCRAAELHLHL